MNVLSAAQGDIAVTFSGKAAHEEKFRDVDWHEEAGVPVLDGTVRGWPGRCSS